MNVTNPATTPADTTTAFFNMLFPAGTVGYLCINHSTPALNGEKPPLLSKWFTTNQLCDAAHFAVSLTDKKNVWFSCGLRGAIPAGYGRGGSNDVIAIPGLWADIDYRHPVHKKSEKLPPDEDTALEFVRSLRIPPTIIIRSGHGLQPYWLFHQVWVFASDAERDAAQEYANRVKAMIGAEAKKRGWKVDAVADLARILRPPGTINIKDPADPRPVEIIECNELRYDPADFDHQLPPLEQEHSNPAPAVSCTTSNTNHTPDDEAILNKAYASKGGDALRRALAGDNSDYGGDASAADLAVCSRLAFWVGRNASRIDAVIRKSARYREKWDEVHSSDGTTYGNMTISKAIESSRDVYEPRVREGKDNVSHPCPNQEDTAANREPAPALPSPISATQLCRSYTALRRPIIHGLLRITEVLGIVGGPKTAKSWAAIDLAVSIASDTPWLDTYLVERGKVLYVDCELHSETFSRRLADVLEARKLLLDHLADRLDVQSLRGQPKDVNRLDRFFRSIDANKYQLIIIDPIYKLLPAGVDENSNSDIAQIFNTVDSWADRLGAAICVIHHTSKGAQGQKTVADTGSGASAQARSVDTHMVIRAHETNGCAVAEAITRSFPPPAPLPMRWQFPLWRPDHSLDPTALRIDGRNRNRKENTEVQSKPSLVWTPEKFVESFISAEPKTEAAIIIAAEAFDLSERRTKRFLATGIDQNVIHRWIYQSRRIPHRFASVAQPVTATVEGVQR